MQLMVCFVSFIFQSLDRLISMAIRKWSALLALPTLLSASPIPENIDASACSQVQSALRPVPNLPPGSSIKGEIPAELAWSCLQSIPINPSAALDLLNSLLPYISFQSNLAFIKNPPPEYAQKVQPPVDVLGALENMAQKIRAGGYRGEYEVCASLPSRNEADVTVWS
jgi:hypothetical protein